MSSQDENQQPAAAAAVFTGARYGNDIAVLSKTDRTATAMHNAALLRDWLGQEVGHGADRLLLVDALGRRIIPDGRATWHGPKTVAGCRMAIAATTAARGLDGSLRQFFMIMAQFGLRQGLLALLPVEGAEMETASVSASAWPAVREEVEQLAHELGFERFEVLPLEVVKGELRPAAWFNGASAVALLQKQPPAGPTGGAGRADDVFSPLRLEIRVDAPVSTDVLEVSLHGSRLEDGAELVMLPAGQRVSIRTVSSKAIATKTVSGRAASPAEDGKVVLQLDRPVDAAAGQVLARPFERPEVADQMAVHLVWAGCDPMLPGRPYMALLNGQRAIAQISTLKHKIDVRNLNHIAADKLQTGEIGYCNLSLDVPLVFDPYGSCRAYGVIEIRDKDGGEELGLALVTHGLRRATNIHWQALAVGQAERASLKGQRPCCLWFTGLSGSGKSTVASLLEKRLQALGRHTYTLDGDNVRHGLNRDLGFTDVDRVENIRRIGEVARLFVDAGLIVMCSFISPFRAERHMVRNLFGEAEFIEVFVDTPLEICEARDIKGLYRKARAGQLKNFTGIDSPYEPPKNAELTLAAGAEDPEAMVEALLVELQRRRVVP